MAVEAKVDDDVPRTAVPTIALSNGVEVPAVGFGCAFGDWVRM